MGDVATYTYQHASTLTADAGLLLATSGGVAAGRPATHPHFFRGFMTAPRDAALGLLAVAEVARTRYFQPLDRASLDPVVTGAPDRLRFESFSGCAGVYARLDVLGAGLDGEVLDHGTTNVDVNIPLRDALARVGGLDPLRLSVGEDALEVTTMDGSVVEKKVPLPTRWLRGFAEVQAIVSRFEARASCGAVEAAALLTALPRGSDRAVLWVVPAGRGLRLTSRPAPGAVCLSGPGRLVALRPLLRSATRLTVYGPAVTTATTAATSVWELSTPTQRVSLTLSPEPRRGFSGEGAVLEALATDEAADDAEAVAAHLSGDPAIDVGALADACGLPAERIRAALTQLGTAGRVGYDVAEAAYFHRVLPYDAAAVARLNPRLVGARALVSAGAVTLAGDHARVRGTDTVHQIRLESSGAPLSCTCAWWAKHRGDRGPCRHALAVTIAARAAAGLAQDAAEVDA